MKMTQQYTKRTANKAARDRLISEHHDRYRQLQREEYEKAGLELPETEREKAQKQLEELLSKHPDLIADLPFEVSQKPAQAVPGAPPPDPPDEDVTDDAELPEGHDFFGQQDL